MALTHPRDMRALCHMKIAALSYCVGAVKPSYICKGLYAQICVITFSWIFCLLRDLHVSNTVETL